MCMSFLDNEPGFLGISNDPNGLPDMLVDKRLLALAIFDEAIILDVRWKKINYTKMFTLSDRSLLFDYTFRIINWTKYIKTSNGWVIMMCQPSRDTP